MPELPPLLKHHCPACQKHWLCRANTGWKDPEPLPCVYPVELLCATCLRKEQP